MDFGDFGKAFTGGGDNFVNTLGGVVGGAINKSPIPIPTTIPSGVQNIINQTPAGKYLGSTMSSLDITHPSTAIMAGLLLLFFLKLSLHVNLAHKSNNGN